MKHGLRAHPLVLVAILVLGRAVAEEPAEKSPEKPPEIHACTDAGGNVSYRTDPCEDARPSRPVVVARAIEEIPTPVPAPTQAPPPRRHVVLNLDEEEAEAEPSGPADPRLGSPEQTWRTLRGAMREGDRALAAACLTSSALAESGSDLRSLPVETLRERADALPEIDVRGVAGPFRVATAKQGGARPKWIFFEKSRKGEWKIAAM